MWVVGGLELMTAGDFDELFHQFMSQSQSQSQSQSVSIPVSQSLSLSLCLCSCPSPSVLNCKYKVRAEHWNIKIILLSNSQLETGALAIRHYRYVTPGTQIYLMQKYNLQPLTLQHIWRRAR